jgi:chromatin structure-remodeling complex protein RSC7
VIDDEVAMEDDEKGDEKVDENGQLLGGKLLATISFRIDLNDTLVFPFRTDREYKVDTFVCPERPNSTKLYMLGIDVAKAAGHTDSSLLARRFQFLVKAYLSESEKVMLLKQGFVGGSNFHNGRPVTIYAARNIFKYMGARIIKSKRGGLRFNWYSTLIACTRFYQMEDT